MNTLWNIITKFGAKPDTYNIDFTFGLAEKLENGIIKILITQIENATDMFINSLLSTPLYFMQTEGFRKIYAITTVLGLSIILPLVAWQGIKLITGRITIDEIGISTKRLIIMPFFITFAPYVIKNLITIVNRICHLILITETTTVYPESITMVLIIFVGIYLYHIIKLLVFYAWRNAAIIFLISISPLLYLWWSMPRKFSKYDKWVNEISSLVLTQLVHTIQLLILLTITKASNDTFYNLLMQIGALVMMSKAPEWLEGYLETDLQVNTNLKGKAAMIKKTAQYMANPSKILGGIKNVFKR